MPFAKCAIYLTNIYVVRKEESLPTWERGLKLIFLLTTLFAFLSLPTWERGLKQPYKPHYNLSKCRSPRGSVD